MDISPLSVAVDKDHKAPLREEVADLLLAVSIRDASHKDLARVAVTMVLVLLLTLLCETHVQRTSHEVLRVHNGAISIGCKLEGCKCESRGRLFFFASSLANDTDLKDMAILCKVIAEVLFTGFIRH